jgi:hypothetical protein
MLRLVSFFFLALATAMGLNAQLAITEVHSSQSTNGTVTLKSDWWELTNFGSEPAEVTGYRFNDATGGLVTSAVTMETLVLGAGESVVFLEQSATTGQPTAADFANWWGASLPASVRVFTYTTNGIGLGSGGDSLTVWNSTVTDETEWVDWVEFGAATAGTTFTFDPVTGIFGALSTNGIHGAFVAADGGDVGSPGTASGPIALSVAEPPASVTANPGDAVTFSAVVHGFPRPRYQWQKDGEDLPGQTAATLVVTNVSSGSVGNFRVRASNGLTTVTSAAAELKVAETPVAPTFTLVPTNQSVLIGGAVSFVSAATGVPQPAFEWRFQGTLLGETGATLSLTNVVATQAGEYSVTATNASGGVTVTVTLAVKDKPDLRITEVHSASTETVDVDFARRMGSLRAQAECGCPAPEAARVTALSFPQEDWWELTSFESEPVSLNGWRLDDGGGRLANAYTVANDVVINPGESVVFVERLTMDQFQAWWGTNELPAGLKLITYSGSGLGLSSGGDGVRLWDAGATVDANTVAKVDFPAGDPGVSFNYDPEAGTFGGLSVPGVNGVYQAPGSIDAELNTTYKNLGSPGRIRAGDVLPPLVAPRVTVIVVNDQVTLGFTAQAGRTYRLQVKGDLNDAEWMPTGDVQTPIQSGPITFVRPQPVAAVAQLYRVLAE